jgi:hypothetical protein
MIHYARFLVRTVTPLLALLLLASAGMQGRAIAQETCYQCQPPNRPTIQLHPNAGAAPQTGVLQNLTDPTIINILPGKVVNRDAFNRPPQQPNIQILGQQNGQNGQPGQPGTPGITRINGMPPVGENRFVPDQVRITTSSGRIKISRTKASASQQSRVTGVTRSDSCAAVPRLPC